MSDVKRGKLVLKEVPAGDVEKKVVLLLSKFAKSASVEELTEKVRNTPYTLSNNIAAEKAVLMMEAFQKLGATAVFIPDLAEKPAAETFTPFKPEPELEPEPDHSFAFHPSSDLEEETPPPFQPAAKKNGTRRLTVTLIMILLILSLGYLAWQLWPLIGDKVLKLWDYLKQLV